MYYVNALLVEYVACQDLLGKIKYLPFLSVKSEDLTKILMPCLSFCNGGCQ